LASTRRGHAVIGAPCTSPWLIPGGQPARPISAMQLTERLRDLGLSPAQSRSTALFELATERPAAILARVLGIHLSVAAAWQRAQRRRLDRLRRRPQPTTETSQLRQFPDHQLHNSERGLR